MSDKPLIEIAREKAYHYKHGGTYGVEFDEVKDAYEAAYADMERQRKEETRIEILNRKIKTLLPVVHEEQYKYAEKLLKDIKKIDKRLKKYSQ